jgi:hypothetical protein
MNSVEYDHEARIRSREEFLTSVPPPDKVFVAAARRAMTSAGLDKEVIELLHPEVVEKVIDAAMHPGR